MILPRYLPAEPFPPYSFVPGRFPHPISDPRGHSHGHRPEVPEIPDPERWHACRPWLRGVDLFNHGFYWEAHEVWEGLWQACGRTGMLADFFKALIHTAAAGVKVRQKLPAGMHSHLKRALELFHATREGLSDGQTHLMGLDVNATIRHLDSWQHPHQGEITLELGTRPLFPDSLMLRKNSPE